MFHTQKAKKARVRIFLGVIVLAFTAIVFMGAAPRRPHLITFPKHFLWGAATAAQQVEGGNTNNDWYQWSVAGKTADLAGAADDEYNRYDQDFGLAASMSHNSTRLSIEWSRIEPQQGVFDWAQVQHYRQVLESAHRHGLRTIVTLHHFTNPIWAADQGGWSNEKMVDWFGDYVAFITANVGDLVDVWMTINEPNVMMLTDYVVGVSPPGKTDVKLGVQVLANLLKGHARAYRIVKAVYPRAWIGFAHHMRVFAGYNWFNPIDLIIAAFIDDFWNNQILKSIKTGQIHLSVPFMATYDEYWPELRGALDFVGVNYYTRDFLKTDFKAPQFFDDVTKPELPHNDLGWEIYPEGLYQMVMRASSFGWPVVITENGIADAADSQRGKFLCDHLKQLSYAMDDGADVRGYLHWALIDNWEWVSGFSAKFGLVSVDYATQKRTVRASAKVLSDVAATNVLSPADCP